jgi:2Fe-2S ferredoxin
MPKITFLPNRLMPLPVIVDVKPDTSILEAAEENHIPVGSACGGVCACSTCHVKIQAGGDNLTEMEDEESDRLDLANDVEPSSRLGCQARLKGGDIVVKISEESLETFGNEHPESRA